MEEPPRRVIQNSLFCVCEGSSPRQSCVEPGLRPGQARRAAVFHSACRIISPMPPTPTSAGVLTFEQARHVVEEHAATLRPRGKELVELLDSQGRILAEPVLA